MIDNIAEILSAYCVGTAPDGDQIVFRMAAEKRSWNSAIVNASGVSIAGSGKYSQIAASYKVRCQGSMTATGYANDCEGQGEYVSR